MDKTVVDVESMNGMPSYGAWLYKVIDDAYIYCRDCKKVSDVELEEVSAFMNRHIKLKK